MLLADIVIVGDTIIFVYVLYVYCFIRFILVALMAAWLQFSFCLSWGA